MTAPLPDFRLPPIRYALSQQHNALVFVRLAHDRRFVGAFLFVLSSSSSSSSSSLGSRGGIVLPMITKGLQSINLVENSSGMCGVMLLLRLLPQVVSTLAYLLLFHLRH